MTDRVFVDTNILVYAYDRSDPAKHAKANAALAELWRKGCGTLSTQVLSEFFVVVTGKVSRPISLAEARDVVRDYLHPWPLVVLTGAVLDRAVSRAVASGRSLWDCTIIEAAIESGCRELYSEDFGHGQHEGDLTFVNPLL